MKEGFNGQQLIRMPQSLYNALRGEDLLMSLCIYAIGYFPHASHHLINRPGGMEGARGQYLLNYCVEGKGWCQLGGRRFPVSANQFFIFPMDTPHSYGSAEGSKWTVYWVRFGGSLAGYFSAGFCEPATIKAGITSRIGFRQDLFEEMYNILDKSYSLENLCYASSLLFSYMASFKFLGAYRKSSDRIITAVNEGALVSEMVHFMQERLEKRITLQDLSDYTGYSVTQMSLIFRRHTGRSPMSYFNLLKIRRACWLLEHTTLKVYQICYKSGFDDPYYFSRLFKKIVGTSPQAYRDEGPAGFKAQLGGFL